MAAPDFTDLSVALATAVRRTQNGNETDLTELLHLSAGTLPDGLTPAFRPFYAAALWIKSHPRWLFEATGDAKFLEPHDAIQELARLQQRVDKSLGLRVPSEWRAEDLLVSFEKPKASIRFYSG